jgi:hypothetical protein
MHRDVYGSWHETRRTGLDLPQGLGAGYRSGESDRCNGRIVAFSITENVTGFHTTA